MFGASPPAREEVLKHGPDMAIPHASPVLELTAEVAEDTGEFSTVITGEIVDAPRAGDSDVPDRIMKNKTYGPVTVHAQSLEELKW